MEIHYFIECFRMKHPLIFSERDNLGAVESESATAVGQFRGNRV